MILFFFFNDTATTEIYTLSLHDALPIFIVFDTLTLADDRLEAFYDNPNALRDYFRDIGRMVLAAEGRKNHTTNITKIVTQSIGIIIKRRSEERFSRNAETDLVCRLLLEKKRQL